MPETGKIVIKVDSELKELIPDFLANRMKDIQTLKTALASSDFETIRIMGHTLQGVGGGYGFDMITDLGSRINMAAKAKDNPLISALIDEFAQYMANIEVVYE